MEAKEASEAFSWMCTGCGQALEDREVTAGGGHVVGGSPPDHCGPAIRLTAGAVFDALKEARAWGEMMQERANEAIRVLTGLTDEEVRT
jgi:hypothetical protein